MTAAATIARALSDRGYDFEIAHIFAIEAMERGRLKTSQTLAEAVETVADMLSPTGIFASTDRPPRRIVEASGRRPQTTKSCGRRSNINHRVLNGATGSWLVT